MDAPASSVYSSRQRAVCLSVLCLVGIMHSMDRTIIGVLVEQIKAEFQVSDTMIGLLSGLSFSVFYATLGIPIARWADRGDRNIVISVSLLAWSAMTAICGFAATFWQLIVARFGVGAGEAGSIPAAQSLIADYFPPRQRARAIAIFTSSQSVGFATSLMLGGVVAHHYGWRAALIMVALLGVLFTPLVLFVLKEPRRHSSFVATSQSGESTMAALRTLFAKPAYRNLLAGIVVYYVMAYGVLAFMVAVMIRVHGQNVAEAGTTFGLVSSVGAVVGGIVGGILADRLAARDVAWLAVGPAWGLMATIPFYELALLASSIPVMAGLLLVATTLLGAVVPAMFTALHVICGSKRRALAVAAAFFFVNLIGIGLGPVISGAMSDMFGAVYGPASGLRYALMIMVLILIPAGLLLLRAARHLKADAED